MTMPTFLLDGYREDLLHLQDRLGRDLGHWLKLPEEAQ